MVSNKKVEENRPLRLFNICGIAKPAVLIYVPLTSMIYMVYTVYRVYIGCIKFTQTSSHLPSEESLLDVENGKNTGREEEHQLNLPTRFHTKYQLSLFTDLRNNTICNYFGFLCMAIGKL